MLDRFVARGYLNREETKTFGIIPSTRLSLGSVRRARLMAEVRAA